MHAKLAFFALIGGLSWCLGNTGWSDVPAPPVNQAIGMPDVVFGELTEADCRSCHDDAVPDRHHLLHGTPIPPGSFVPFRDANGDGTPDAVYGCLNCHDKEFTPVRDCTACHTSNAHHRTPAAANRDCVSCHGDIVDNIGDGHYIPTYPPSRVTPSTSDGDGLPLNSRRNGAGACDYCHDNDGLQSPIIRTNMELHHATSYAAEGTLDCLTCHGVFNPLDIRVCENCHGPESLHNIQADSPYAPNLGTIVVGGEYAGYGHVGRDAGPGDSDCWGCHGFATAASAPDTGPIIPTVYRSDVALLRAGVDATVTLTGASFVNTMGPILYESDVTLTSADGAVSLTLIPDIIVDEGALVVTIPGNTPPGNYDVRAVKDRFASNPTVISIIPQVTITRAVASRGLTTINGGGFGGYAAGSGTTVTGTYLTRVGRHVRVETMEGRVISWNDRRIVVSFSNAPGTVKVRSVFGSAVYRILPE